MRGLLFASIHGDPPRFLVYLVLGLFCGWLTQRYRSLLPAIALHSLNNTMAVLLNGYPDWLASVGVVISRDGRKSVDIPCPGPARGPPQPPSVCQAARAAMLR